MCVSQCVCRGQRTTFTMWVLGIELRSLSLAASAQLLGHLTGLLSPQINLHFTQMSTSFASCISQGDDFEIYSCYCMNHLSVHFIPPSASGHNTFLRGAGFSRHGFSVWQLWLSWNSLCRPGWPWTHRSPCFCLPSARIKDLCHCRLAHTFFFEIKQTWSWRDASVVKSVYCSSEDLSSVPSVNIRWFTTSS